MATSRALSAEVDQSIRERKSGVEGLHRPARRAEGVYQEGMVKGSSLTEVERVAQIHDKIARTTSEDGGLVSKYQERYDRILVDRHDRYLTERARMRAEIDARLAVAGIEHAQRSVYLQRPALLKEAQSAGKMNFVALVRRYEEQGRHIQSEYASYIAAVKRLGLVEHGRRASVKREERSSSPELQKLQQKLGQLFEGTLRKDTLTSQEAAQVHREVVSVLHGIQVPEEGHSATHEERDSLVVCRYLYQQIECRLDEVRVRELRDIVLIAQKARLAMADGASESASLLKETLRSRLSLLAPLYLLKVDDAVGHFVDRAEQFQMDHAWWRRLQDWAATADASVKSQFVAQADALHPRVLAERKAAYPFGPTLGSVPLEAYQSASA